MFESNFLLSANVVEWFSMYTNPLLYDMAHQEHNHSFTKLCNLLYLLHSHYMKSGVKAIDLTQEDMSNILGISRVNLTRGLAQLRSEGIVTTHR